MVVRVKERRMAQEQLSCLGMGTTSNAARLTLGLVCSHLKLYSILLYILLILHVRQSKNNDDKAFSKRSEHGGIDRESSMAIRGETRDLAASSVCSPGCSHSSPYLCSSSPI